LIFAEPSFDRFGTVLHLLSTHGLTLAAWLTDMLATHHSFASALGPIFGDTSITVAQPAYLFPLHVADAVVFSCEMFPMLKSAYSRAFAAFLGKRRSYSGGETRYQDSNQGTIDVILQRSPHFDDVLKRHNTTCVLKIVMLDNFGSNDFRAWLNGAVIAFIQLVGWTFVRKMLGV
jgi:hypothetical protein